MTTPSGAGPLTVLLREVSGGDRAAADRVVEIVYRELRAVASRYLHRERPGHTLQPTALVDEAYLRLFGGSPVDWQNRQQFFAVAAQQMRRILVDHARARLADKRGGQQVRVTLTDIQELAGARPPDLLEVDEALTRLAVVSHRAARVVELRFFAGMSEEETAAALAISEGTVKRDWRFARAWLLAQLAGDGTRSENGPE